MILYILAKIPTSIFMHNSYVASLLNASLLKNIKHSHTNVKTFSLIHQHKDYVISKTKHSKFYYWSMYIK